jgi:hypothetical protein
MTHNHYKQPSHIQHQKHVVALRGHAIFPKVETHGHSILQQFIQEKHPNCTIKQQHTCIKFKHSASALHTISHTPYTLIYNKLEILKSYIEDLTTFISHHKHIITSIDTQDFHFLDEIPIFISQHKIIAETETNNSTNNSTNNTHLANILQELIATHTTTLPPLSPIQRFIDKFSTPIV